MKQSDLIKQIVSLFILLKALLATFSVSYQLITQTVIRNVSTRIFGYDPEGPLMGSYLIHILLHPVVGYCLASMGVCLVVKEFRGRTINKKLLLNVAGLFVALFFGALYVWVFGHGYLIPPS